MVLGADRREEEGTKLTMPYWEGCASSERYGSLASPYMAYVCRCTYTYSPWILPRPPTLLTMFWVNVNTLERCLLTHLLPEYICHDSQNSHKPEVCPAKLRFHVLAPAIFPLRHCDTHKTGTRHRNRFQSPTTSQSSIHRSTRVRSRRRTCPLPARER